VNIPNTNQSTPANLYMFSVLMITDTFPPNHMKLKTSVTYTLMIIKNVIFTYTCINLDT